MARDFTFQPSDAPHIARLSKRHAECLALSRGGASYEAMAISLGIPVGTVKSRVHRARAKIVRLRAKAAEAASCAT
jgi:RNA polymerase sigma-70 factor (ECF subfamily)